TAVEKVRLAASETTALNTAKEQAAIAKEVTDFIHKMFIEARPGSDRQFLLRTFLDKASTGIESQSKDALSEASIRELLGSGYQLCQEGPGAQSQLERAYHLREQ